jgi:hypothetical protein
MQHLLHDLFHSGSREGDSLEVNMQLTSDLSPDGFTFGEMLLTPGSPGGKIRRAQRFHFITAIII